MKKPKNLQILNFKIFYFTDSHRNFRSLYFFVFIFLELFINQKNKLKFFNHFTNKIFKSVDFFFH